MGAVTTKGLEAVTIKAVVRQTYFILINIYFTFDLIKLGYGNQGFGGGG